MAPISGITLDHVAVAVPSVPDALARWVAELGGVYLWGGDNGAFQSHDIRYRNGANLELLQPTEHGDGNDFVSKFLERRGAGIHHLTFKVGSLGEALERVAEHDLDAVDIDMSRPWWKEAFLRPSQVGRIVIQLAESGEHDHGDGSHWHEPPAVEAPAWGAELVGPLLSMDSFDRAEGLYAGLLGGEAERDGERVVYRWPDSPLVVTLVPDDRAGARCLLVSGWDGQLPSHPHFGPPVLPVR